MFPLGQFKKKKKKSLKKCLKSSASGFTLDSSLLTPWHRCHFLQGLVKDSVRDLWDFAYYFVGPWPLVTPANHTESVCVQRYRVSLHLLFIRISQRSTISSKPEVWFQTESSNPMKAFLIIHLLKTCYFCSLIKLCWKKNKVSLH